MTKSADKFLPAVIENYKAMSHTALHNTPFVIAMARMNLALSVQQCYR